MEERDVPRRGTNLIDRADPRVQHLMLERPKQDCVVRHFEVHVSGVVFDDSRLDVLTFHVGDGDDVAGFAKACAFQLVDASSPAGCDEQDERGARGGRGWTRRTG